MKKIYQLDFQKIRRKTQIKDFTSFEIYLKNIFSDLAKREWKEKEDKGIEKIAFIDYMNLPFIVGEKLFNVIGKNGNGFLSQTEFVSGIINLYVGGLEETQKIIFNMLDFDNDGIIIPEDSRLLISFIKNLANPPQKIMKIKQRTTSNDEENLDEINSIISNFFNNKPKMTFEEYKYNIENINSDVFFLFICFLYNNKPFNDSSIKILKLLNKNSHFFSSASSNFISCTSDDCTNDSKYRIRSPSKVFKSFILDLVDLDIDEIQRDCGENSGEENKENMDEDINNNQIFEGSKKISLPNIQAKINLEKLKGNKDYLLNNYNNQQTIGTVVIKNTFKNFMNRIKDTNTEEDEAFINSKDEASLNNSVNIKHKSKKSSFIMDYTKKIWNEDEKFCSKFDTENSNKINSISRKDDDYTKTGTKINIIEENSQNNTINDYRKFDTKNTLFNKKSQKNNYNRVGTGLLGNDSISIYDEVSITDIVYENYIFKSRNNNKLKKYYIVLIGMDLFYFSNSKKKKLRGMHNLSASYIYEDDNVIKVREEYGKNKNEPSTVLYYPFKLYFKKKARIYYCPNEDEAKMWIKHIRSVTKFREVKENYDFGEELGSGKFGKVKLGNNKQTKKKVAIKTIDKSKLKGTEVEMVKTEIEIMKFCRHRKIVRLIDNFEDMENIYIVLEYLSGRNLNFFLSQQQTLLSEERIKELIKQMAKGIFYLHNFGIIHRDLKPENSMMSDLSENAFLKIVDFGLSKIMGINEKSNEAYGTLSYAAPEVIQKSDYDNKVDIWSLGVIMYFLICGYLPFNDKNNNFTKIAADITKGQIKFDPSIWSRISSESKDLVMKCLERDVKKRLNILEFLDHSWFIK